MAKIRGEAQEAEDGLGRKRWVPLASDTSRVIVRHRAWDYENQCVAWIPEDLLYRFRWMALWKSRSYRKEKARKERRALKRSWGYV